MFVVAPIIMVVIYALSALLSADFTLDNFANMGTYTVVFTRSFKLALIATADLRCSSATPCPTSSPRRARRLQRHGHGAHHAAHVDEFPAADLFLDGHSGEQRTFEPAVPADRPDRPLQPDRYALCV